MVAAGVLLVLTGCSGMPYFPGRVIEPSPAPVTSTPMGSTPAHGGARPADLDLAGGITTDKGTQVGVESLLWLGPTTTSPSPDHAGDQEWVNVHAEFSGHTSVINEGTSAEAAAGAVLYEYNAGWVATSSVCRLLLVSDGSAAVRGSHCWRRLGSASLLDPQLRLLYRLQPGEQQTITITADSAPGGLSIDVPSAQVGQVERAFERPDVLVVTTSDALRDDSQADALRGACEEEQVGPTVRDSAPSARARPLPPIQHVIVAATTPLKCAQLPPLSE